MQKRYIAICAAAAAVSAAAQGAPGFSHEMPKGTNEKPLDTPYAEMAETFRNPFDKVQTGCYWYWMGGNISCDGVRKDLEAMKKAGIDRPYIGDIGGGGNKKGSVKTLSPEWNEVLQTAFSTASRLGIEIGLFNSPGWSQSGGPWVKPEMAMRRVVSSVVVMEGPADGVVLPAPKFEYAPQKDMRDVCAIAYPVPKGLDGRLEKRTAKDAPLEAAKDKPLVVELASPEPFEAQSAEIVLASGKGSGDIVVEAETGGAWKRICKMPYSRYNHGPGVGFAPHAPIFVAFSPTTAKRFRVTVSTTRTDAAAGFASVAVCTAPHVERAVEKSLGKMHETPLPMWNEYKWPVETECAEGSALDPSKAVVLTGKVAPDGKLDWKVPAGTWAIYRIACAPTGTKNGPANPEATGYEVDKMSREHIAAHFDAYLGKILEATPPESRKAIRHAVLDSYEQGGQNFTDHFAEKFKASFGYDPTPYLPVLNGMAVGSRADSDRFLWDLRRFVADEVAYSYVGGLRKASNAHGMETWLECYGHWGFPGEFLQYGGQSDGIAGEYWCEGSLGDIENRAASSCAHIYGRRLVWAESNTSAHKWFERGPMDLKQRTDRFFAEGLNATILHVYIQQDSDRKPGRIAWFGNEFNRHNSWFGHFDLFTGYLKRCGWMLRQGLNVADVAYFIGEDAPCMTGVCDPALPAGRQFDYINAEVLTETASVDEKGRIVLPHGTAYEVLVLPKLETMRPKMAECVERLVNAGATVIGPRPVRSPSLAGQPESDAKVREIAERLWGGGKISASMTLEEALAKRKSEPDVVFDAKRKLAYAHRTMPKAEIYFVSNQSGEAMPSVDVSFRVAGRAPELWDAATGESRAAGNWREDKGRTSVTLSLAKHESVFVVFPKEAGKCCQCGNVANTNVANGQLETGIGNTGNNGNILTGALREINLAGPWTVEFESDGLHRGPKEPVKFDKLIDLSTSDDPAIKFYSGKLVYRTKFALSSSLLPLSSSLSLDLGEVSVTAKVKVNGKDAGGVCFASYRLDIAPFVKAGENDLEIEVCNLWVNRLVGDDGDPDRQTWTSIPCCDRKKTKLPKSGLIGPVSIQCVAAGKSVDSGKIAAADAAARGEVSVVGIPHSFPDGRIDWLFNPTAKKGPFNPEWTWQLNRMSFWGVLADAYSATGDEKYARAFVRQFSDWFAQTGGVPPERDFNCVGSPWRTIEEGIRLSGSWHTAWRAFSKSPSFCGKVREDFVKSAHAQARHLLAHPTSHNWLLLEMTGAYVFALDFPDLPDAEEIRRTALLRFYDAASKQLCPDGQHDEVSLDYHSVFYSTAAAICLRAIEAGKGGELPKGFLELLERGAEGPLAQITPNFYFPCFNDSHTFRASDIFGMAAKLFPSREDFLWAATEGREGAPPAGKTASRFLPYSGIAVMRSGWDRDATYLAFDVGPTGANHVHQDKLSFTFWKGGEELVFDDGGGQYEQSGLRRYAISGYDHSTLLVDGLAQNRSSPRVCARPIDAGWRSDGKEDFAFGVYDQGFGPKELRLARHRREIRFDKKADEFHVSDIVESADGKDHDYTLLFQIDSTNVLLSADSRSLYADFGRGRKWALEMTLPEGAKPETASGRLKPAPAGWFFGRIGTVPDVHPATTLFVKFPPMKSLKAVTRFRAVGVK